MESSSHMSRQIDRQLLNELAIGAGLVVAGVTTPEPFDHAGNYAVDHIERGHLSGFSWFTAERARQSADPRTLHGDVRSIVSVAVPFWTGVAQPPDDKLRGRIARYAWGRDYHKTLKKRMQALAGRIAEATGVEIESRQLVDTARVFDRAVAARAGVGWYGKNSMIIVPGHGSWVMLGALYLDIEIEPDAPLDRNCGRCTICIDNCPTGAIVEPYRIDAPRCISYLTIEERGPIPRHLRPFTGSWVFGCDVCQDVCPYTGAAQVMTDQDFQPATVENVFPSLDFLATMTEQEFRATYSGTAVTRAKRAGMARNAALALGNSNDQRAESILTTMLATHDEPLARGHAAWGLRRLLGDDATSPLERALSDEHDVMVQEEIRWALEHDIPAAGTVKPIVLRS
jgi:epoxyqueuosine reductase